MTKIGLCSVLRPRQHSIGYRLMTNHNNTEVHSRSVSQSQRNYAACQQYWVQIEQAALESARSENRQEDTLNDKRENTTKHRIVTSWFSDIVESFIFAWQKQINRELSTWTLPGNTIVADIGNNSDYKAPQALSGQHRT